MPRRAAIPRECRWVHTGDPPARHRADRNGAVVSARDDYPAAAILHDAWTARDRDGETAPEAVQMFQELERWERTWELAGRPGGLGGSKSASLARLVLDLRGKVDAWMNGVADVVEPYGYDRHAASGPADLLPGLTDLVERLRNCVEARSVLYEHVHELTTRLERHPVTTGGHEPIRQPGSNLCVCGEWFDAEVHQS